MRWTGMFAGGAAGVAALAGAGAARGNIMFMACNGLQVFHVEDNGWYDDNPAINVISYVFLITPESASWVASGTITGVFVPGQSATTTITSWRVFRLGGPPVMTDTITWGQEFETLPGTPTTTSGLDGRYDSFSHQIGGTDLLYQAGAMAGGQSLPLTAIDPQFAAGPGPIPFSGQCAPMSAPGIDHHVGGLTFRLDAIGDVIEATSDITIVSTVPGPGALAALLTGMALATGRRRMRPT